MHSKYHHRVVVPSSMLGMVATTQRTCTKLPSCKYCSPIQTSAATHNPVTLLDSLLFKHVLTISIHFWPTSGRHLGISPSFVQILGFHDLRQVQHRSTWNPTPSVTSVSSQHRFSMDSAWIQHRFSMDWFLWQLGSFRFYTHALLSFEHKALETKPSCIGLSRSSPLRNISVGSGFGDGLFRLRVQTRTPRIS